MSATGPLRETRDIMLARAQEALQMAASEPLIHRARILLAAAKRWQDLADRKMPGRLKMRDSTLGEFDKATEAPP